ncbi:MAG: helix-turn-helix domain-containing protein [Clostridiales bacterium]|nr:helix-turn-helix domain-containing protein [Clostridiales bacterium]
MVDFGSRLKKLRLDTGLTQKQLADKLGVTKSVVSYYEQQERNPSPEILVQLSRIFHTSTDFLLGLDNKKVLDVSELSDEEFAIVRELVEALKKKHK